MRERDELNRGDTGEEQRERFSQEKEGEEGRGDIHMKAKENRDEGGEMIWNEELEALRSHLLTQEILGSIELAGQDAGEES